MEASYPGDPILHCHNHGLILPQKELCHMPLLLPQPFCAAVYSFVQVSDRLSVFSARDRRHPLNSFPASFHLVQIPFAHSHTP